MSKFSKTGTSKSETSGRTNTGSTIRGKISAPIPIKDDDEFPIRSPGTSIATPLGSLRSDGVEKVMRDSAISGRDSALAYGDIGMGDYIEPPRRIGTSPLPSDRPSYNPPSRRTQDYTVLRSSSPVGRPSDSVLLKPARKKSTLKGVFGKIFGKKRKDAPTQRQGVGALQSEQHHRSDPTALSRNPINTPTSPKRSTSMPINEFNRALRSHSPFIGNNLKEQNNTERDTNRTSTQTQSTTTRTRVATGRLYTPDKTPGFGDWTGLSPRPASAQAKGSKAPSDEECSGLIGMAITSGSHPNRRSRSLGQLREAAGVVGGMTRRRSDEIRYWRASYDPGPLSPLSSTKAEADEPILVNDPESPRPIESRDQPQPFNFGHLSGLAGMKITQAADLATRVDRIESRLVEMEKTVYQIHRQLNGNGDHVTLQDPPKGGKRDRSSSERRPPTDNSEMTLPVLPRHRHWHEFGAQNRLPNNNNNNNNNNRPTSSSHNNSYHPDFDDTVPAPYAATTDDHVRLSSSHTTCRPLSTSTTIRGLPSSSPTTQKDAPLTMEHYNHLTNMFLAEQSARQHLESIVLTLQQQAVSYPSVAPASYPTPNSVGGAGLVLDTTSSSRSTFKGFGGDSDDEAYAAASEVFQTPNEDLAGPNFGDEVFGSGKESGSGSARPGVDTGKGDARTLSLSQITLGKGLQHSLNF
ncbi:e8e5e9ea-acae-4fe2-9e89-441a0b1b4348 [Sclerotinia trifoliorum]|uniref:E8e5e9ea-acae-4fe2-9e89-441a0b1b4348 n=1 Tax=Sclerotinia trifoliorum TaxID=28548 RepID=A0A8H2VWL8_9HELO|nr:e8e5e9ea-acae-4fe2-9e89-441a0b1b4348 [Sclerotinia trifoliorum]